ncbi:MAG: penicillin-binding protein [Actinomycetota bacterium]|nr:penicillin-binding protein [Actinomycetota bacterium]
MAFFAGALALFMVFGALGVVYAATQIPLPGQVRTSQKSIIYYSDGRTEMARVGMENRTDVKLSAVPKDVQRAVLAAENRDYYTDNGVSPKGILRALWADLRGKDLQGGSTITQQYAKNAYLSQQRTYTRKFREIVIAVKLDHSYSKDQVLEWYLNTIYFGRGAYGIEAAAETYFGIPTSRLSLEQGAVLASSIRSPAGYDPAEHPQAARDRWRYVLDGMVKKDWLTSSRAGQAKYPTVRPPGNSPFNDLSGPKGYIVRQVEKELQRHGISDDVLRRSGLRVVTTIDRQAQASAVAAVAKVFTGQPANLRQALVAIEPSTGRVRAYYGGKSGNGGLDYATHSYQPGSSMKPYVLAEALSQGISLKSRWDGSSPQTFPDRTAPVYNSGDGQGEQCGHCNLITATVLSLNTVFYALTAKVTAVRAARRAEAAGIRTLAGEPIEKFIHSGKLSNGFGIGQFEITPIDQADGYATFAADGVQHDAYFVDKVARIDNGSVVYSAKKSPGRRAFAPAVAADATYAMQQVIKSNRGTSFDRSLADDRPAAAKTGTAEDPHAKQANGNGGGNSAAWMCGFTPQLAAVVWVGHDNLRTPLVTRTGRQIYGVGLPALTWQAFMDGALRGQPIRDFPPPANVGTRDVGNVTPGTPASTPAPAPQRTPSPPPVQPPSPTPSVPAVSPSPQPRPSRSRCTILPLCPSPSGPP